MLVWFIDCNVCVLDSEKFGDVVGFKYFFVWVSLYFVLVVCN